MPARLDLVLGDGRAIVMRGHTQLGKSFCDEDGESRRAPSGGKLAFELDVVGGAHQPIKALQCVADRTLGIAHGLASKLFQPLARVGRCLLFVALVHRTSLFHALFTRH